jgi:hypothetical protein
LADWLWALMYNADLIGRPNVVFTPHDCGESQWV